MRNIKAVLSKCDEIVIATDVDPTGEGELLAYEIIEELKLNKKKISGMYFADESVSEIQKAFNGRKTIPDFYGNPDYRKALYRAKFDYLTMQFTRIATACGDGQSVVRRGRLKSAMVSIVGAKLDAVKITKKYRFIQTVLKMKTVTYIQIRMNRYFPTSVWFRSHIRRDPHMLKPAELMVQTDPDQMFPMTCSHLSAMAHALSLFMNCLPNLIRQLLPKTMFTTLSRVILNYQTYQNRILNSLFENDILTERESRCHKSRANSYFYCEMIYFLLFFSPTADINPS